jgi:hypothetical protein
MHDADGGTLCIARKARVSLGTVTGGGSLAKQLNWRRSTEKFRGLEEATKVPAKSMEYLVSGPTFSE